MTAALVPHWIAAGHEVVVGGRNTAHAQELGDRLGVQHGSLADAADFGEVVLLAVRSEGLVECMEMAGSARGTLSPQRDHRLRQCGAAQRLLPSPMGRSVAG